jgi:hypothetical protein
MHTLCSEWRKRQMLKLAAEEEGRSASEKEKKKTERELNEEAEREWEEGREKRVNSWRLVLGAALRRGRNSDACVCMRCLRAFGTAQKKAKVLLPQRSKDADVCTHKPCRPGCKMRWANPGQVRMTGPISLGAAQP